MGKAVRRNRIKRLIKECFRRNREALSQDVDLVVVPKKRIPTKTLTYQQVEDDLVPRLCRISRELPAVS
jgi:ribonuclease P protein component